MDLQAIGTSKKCILKPSDKIAQSRRTSAANLVAAVGILVYRVGVANSKDKDNTLLAQQRRFVEEVGLLGPLV